MGKLTDTQLRAWVRAGKPLAGKSDGAGLTFTLSAAGAAGLGAALPAQRPGAGVQYRALPGHRPGGCAGHRLRPAGTYP